MVGQNFQLFLDLKKERENFQETKEGEERHFQRNIVRLNEEIERERMFRLTSNNHNYLHKSNVR